MNTEHAFDATQAAEPLYRWWLDTIPTFFAAFAPNASAEAAVPPAAAAQPFPMGQVSQALALTQAWVKPLYEALFQAMAVGHPGEAFDAVEQLVQGRMGILTDRLTAMSQAAALQPGPASLGTAWMTAPFAMFDEALKPLTLNLERAYGGLADAFGLAGSRELQQALRDMAAAALAHRQAQAEYFGLVAGALAKGADALMTRLAETGRRGESIDSVKALLRLWARTTDEAMQGAMQAPQALEASARLIRTATRSRQQQQRVVALASEALNVPTRAEVDEAYREIQELKRELRRLRKPVAPEAAASDPVAAPKRARTPRAAAKRKTARKDATA